MENVIHFPKTQELKLEEAAAFLRMSPKTLRNKLQARSGPRHLKRGGRLFFLIPDLEAFDKSRTQVREAY